MGNSDFVEKHNQEEEAYKNLVVVSRIQTLTAKFDAYAKFVYSISKGLKAEETVIENDGNNPRVVEAMLDLARAWKSFAEFSQEMLAEHDLLLERYMK